VHENTCFKIKILRVSVDQPKLILNVLSVGEVRKIQQLLGFASDPFENIWAKTPCAI